MRRARHRGAPPAPAGRKTPARQMSGQARTAVLCGIQKASSCPTLSRSPASVFGRPAADAAELFAITGCRCLFKRPKFILEISYAGAMSRDVETFEFGKFVLIPRERQLVCGKEVVPLSGKGFDLLVALVRRHGRLVTKDELFDESGREPSSRRSISASTSPRSAGRCRGSRTEPR